MDRLAERIDRIKAILADDKNYQADSLKIGAIWDVCDRAASYKRGKDISGGDFIEVLPPSQSLSQESVRSEALEEAAGECKHLALYGPPEYSLAFCQAEEAIRALQSTARVAEQKDVHENELRDGQGNRA